MRVGIAGTGSMGKIHRAAWLKTSAEITGIISGSIQEARSFAQRLGVRAYENLDDMLGDIDVLDVCVPTFLHHKFVMAAAKSGVHVICEKPLARTLEEGRQMLSECQREGVKLLPAHVLRFSREYEAAKTALKMGEVGQVAVLRFNRDSYVPQREGYNWFLDEEKSGGILLDLCYHDIDCARWLAGEVSSVYAQTVRTDHPDFPADYALVIMEHQSGALSHVRGSWALPEPEFQTSFEIAGSEGLLCFSSLESSPVIFDAHRRQSAENNLGRVGLPELDSLSESPYEREIQMFYNHIENGIALPVSDMDALAALEISLEAIESARTGQPRIIAGDSFRAEVPSR